MRPTRVGYPGWGLGSLRTGKGKAQEIPAGSAPGGSRNHSGLELQVKYHEDFEKSKGSFTPVVTDPITERVKKNMQDFSDISYRGIQRRVVEMERKRVDQDQENLTGEETWAHLFMWGFNVSSATSILIHQHLEMFSSKSFLEISSHSTCKSPAVPTLIMSHCIYGSCFYF